MKLFDLTGKRALVTGGSRGIGRALAEALGEAGATVAINSASERIFTTAQELQEHTGQTVIPIQADLAQRDETKRLFDEALSKLGGLDIIFVNHGIQRVHDAAVFPAEDWDLVLEVDLISLFLLDQLAGRYMLAHNGGKIVNIASLLSVVGGMRVPAYAAAKGGVAQLTKALSNEWAGRGVTVNAIVPGFIHTDLTEDLVNDPGEGASLLARIPVQRWGVPDDLKGIAMFLASAASNYVSGAIIPVDGGFLARWLSLISCCCLGDCCHNSPFLLMCSQFGRRLYAVGNDIEAARKAGINTDCTTFSAYVVSVEHVSCL